MIIKAKKTYPSFMSAKQAKLRAQRRVWSYKMNADEIILNNYLLANFSISLKILCTDLIKYSQTAEDNNVFITYFIHKDKDKLARFISYGNNKIPGSNILRYAFSN